MGCKDGHLNIERLSSICLKVIWRLQANTEREGWREKRMIYQDEGSQERSPGSDSQDRVGVGTALGDGQAAHEGVVLGHQEEGGRCDLGDVLLAGPMLVVILHTVIPAQDTFPQISFFVQIKPQRRIQVPLARQQQSAALPKQVTHSVPHQSLRTAECAT